MKLVLPNSVETDSYQITSLVAQSPDGRVVKVRPKPEVYAAIVAATNFKQRTRKLLEYYYADLLNYAVIGTPNRVEYDQGFFLKNGDGARSEEHTSELQSLLRNSYAVFCLNKNT